MPAIPADQLTPPLPPALPAPAPAPPRRSTRKRHEPDRFGTWAKSPTDDAPVNTPKTWNQLQKSPNKQRWIKAAEEEFSSLVGMDTWRLVPRTQRRKIIKSKWVFKVKRRAKKSIHKLKVRLVAMGYTQVKGIDYDEVFSPTLRQETFRLICSLLANKNWKARQVDFKTAFLNGCLAEPVYMEQPQGFEDPHHPNWVCKVTRSIYGLKQLPRKWNLELHQALLSNGLTQSTLDPTLYFSLRSKQLVGTVAIHVDNLAIVGEPSFVDPLINKLGKRFAIGANEELHHFISLEVDRNQPNRLVYLCQQHYIDDLQT
jgi:hypothetical protein